MKPTRCALLLSLALFSSMAHAQFAGTWGPWGDCIGDDYYGPITCLTGGQNRDCLVNGEVDETFLNCEGGGVASFRNCPPCTGTWGPWSQCIVGEETAVQVRVCFLNGQFTPLANCEGGADADHRFCPPPDECLGEFGILQNDTDCPFPGVWGAFHACSVGCGGGSTYRDCLVNGQISGNNSLCEGGQGAATRPCNTVPCGTIIGTWSPFLACSLSCNGGVQTRNCLVNGSISDPSYCAGNATRPCNTQPCGTVFAGVWSSGHACPVSCGSGLTYRDCILNGAQVDYSNCEGESNIPCNTQPCDGEESSSSSSTGGLVFAGVWSNVHACPVSCGGGSTYRDCLVNGQQAAYSNCEGDSTRPCNTQPC